MSESKNSASARGRVGFWGLLTVVFVVLKLTGHIDWSWWGLSLLWITVELSMAALLLVRAAWSR